jgi:hypothetical protein
MAVFRRRDGRPAPAGPQRSGGRRQPSFLSREECAPAQGKKVGGAVAGTRPAGARPATKRGPPGRLQAQSPGENDADRQGQRQRTPAARSGSPQRARAQCRRGQRDGAPRGASLGRRFKTSGQGRPARHTVHQVSRRPDPIWPQSTTLCPAAERRSANLAP